MVDRGKHPPVEDSGFRPRGRTVHNILSLALALLALGWVLTRIDLQETWQLVRQADFRWYLLGFGSFYLSLPLRAWRWQLLFRTMGERVPMGALMSLIFRAWTVNCALPGRTGDLYSAYALKQERGLGLAATMGTVFTARVLDLLTLVMLAAVVFFWKFRQELPPAVGTLVYLGLGLGVLVLVVFWLLNRATGLGNRLLPRRWAEAYVRFAGATRGNLKHLPVLLPVTCSLWLLEAFRLWCVMSALGISLPTAQVVFLALAAAVLTALPITPGGLGTVEALYREFLPAAGVAASGAAGVAVLDRTINYWFILVAGGLFFLWVRVRSAQTTRRLEEQKA